MLYKLCKNEEYTPINSFSNNSSLFNFPFYDSNSPARKGENREVSWTIELQKSKLAYLL